MIETMMTDTMMIGEEQEETIVLAMRREEKGEEEAGAIAQITETVGDTIA